MTRAHRRESVIDRTLRELIEYRRNRANRRAIRKRAVLQTHRLGKQSLFLSLLLMVMLSSFVMTVSPFPANQPRLNTSGNSLKAALIDSLSLTDPDPLFISNVTRSLFVAGYTLDYFGPNQVTVDLFRNLALQNYRIVIIRGHTAIFQGIPTSLTIVTSEPYSSLKHVYEQLTGQVAPAIVRPGNTFFAITPAFIRDAMKGNLRDTLVVQMGCGTLTGNSDIGTAFIDKGASAFVGWNDTVSSWYTDLTMQKFVSLLARGHTVADAVNGAGGPDPVYGGKLGFLDTAATSQAQFNIRMTAILGAVILISITLFVARKIVRDHTTQTGHKRRTHVPSYG